MKKVGIITLFYKNNNYGGVLQAYALQRVIKSLGHECDIINYRPEKLDYSILQNLKDYAQQRRDEKLWVLKVIKQILSVLISKLKSVPEGEGIDFSKKRQMFAAFIDEYIDYTETVTHDTVHKIVDQYQVYISGSDQVWNPAWYERGYFLDFVPEDIPKVSYAASIGKNNLTKAEETFMSQYLSRFKQISVRENEAKDILERFYSDPVRVVLDPTLLLQKDEWQTLLNNRCIEDKYIFVYLLGNEKTNREAIRKYAKEKSLKIVNLIPLENRGVKECLEFGDIKIVDAGPQEFLDLICHASYICTDSFHGTAFSVMFEKEFYIFHRTRNNGRHSMNSRIITLLDNLELKREFVDTEIKEKCIDYQNVKEKLSQYQEASIDFIKNVLDED